MDAERCCCCNHRPCDSAARCVRCRRRRCVSASDISAMYRLRPILQASQASRSSVLRKSVSIYVIFDAACIFRCAEQGLYNGRVSARVSVRPFVCLSRRSTAAAACRWFAAECARASTTDIDRMAGTPAAGLSSKCGRRHVDSRGSRLNTDLSTLLSRQQNRHSFTEFIAARGKTFPVSVSVCVSPPRSSPASTL